MRYQSYFNTAIRIIQLYDGSIPLSHFLKQYFSEHKKHGSKDRKIITNICYHFYRLGKAFINENIEEKLKIAIFVCANNLTEWSFLYKDEWLKSGSPLLQQRIAFIQQLFPEFSLRDIFPFAEELSENLDATAFETSFFIQPDVFLRIRPNSNNEATQKLNTHNIAFNYVDENCIAVNSSTKIDLVIDLDKEAVVQDYSSQQIRFFLAPINSELLNRKSNIITRTSVWDCCAGSGGKSILAYDELQNIDLTVSDVRASIIQNLKQRFAKAGIKNHKALVTDISNSKFKIQNSNFDIIICDAPCTGSGTWSRTPEQLYFFQPQKINDYALLQQKIVSNAIPFLNENGYFLYITCSVFKKENELIADFIKQQFHLELIKMELLKGYHKKADTMFAALFKKAV
ncbi:MAG: methyltransferase domain-containing protein [Parafilimonas sp.]|nr:methyltransferase domain-containing protein [Parafilimonas sp.]